MIRFVRTFLILTVLLLVASGRHAAAAAESSDSWKAAGGHGAIATGTKEAADAGIAVLQNGGNAIDAAAAALLVLNVTDPGNFCFGGEVSMIVFDARRKVVEVLCGQGAAPRLATAEYFQKRGAIPGGGDPTTAAVPGAFDAVLTVLSRHGTLSFQAAAAPMLSALERRTESWGPDLARTIRRLVDAERGSGGDRQRGLRLVADYFYRGPIAREIDAWSREFGGLIRYSDLATHTTRVEEPVSIEYRGYTIYKCGVWSQGPFLLETLRLLEGFDLKSMGHNQPDYIHVVVEALKLGLADRDTYYADPLFVDVPLKELLSTKYAEMRRPLLDRRRASRVQRPGDPRAGQALLIANPKFYQETGGAIHDTTTCLVADQWGNLVAATPSGWGGVTAGKTGVVLGSRLRSFNIWKGHPNCIEPGKRPRNTLTPTIVTKNGQPAFAISVAGGDWQDQVTLNVLLNLIEFGMNPAQAVTADRFGTDHFIGSFNQTPPKLASLSLYTTIGQNVIADLKARGHEVTVAKPPLWHPVALSVDPATGLKQAAGDPKANRHSAAY